MPETVEGLAAERPAASVTIWARLARALGTMAAVAKSGYNEDMRFWYMTDGDLMEAARAAFAGAGLVLVPELLEDRRDEIPPDPVPEGGREAPRKARKFRTEVRLALHLFGAGGEEAGPFPWKGEAIDTYDKGLAKAMTSAVKTWMQKVLMQGGIDDPDRDGGGDGGKGRRPRATEGPEAEAGKVVAVRAKVWDLAKRCDVKRDELTAAAVAVGIPRGMVQDCQDVGKLEALRARLEATHGKA